MNNFNVNISTNDVEEQYNQEKVVFKPKTNFDVKNYLNARLADNENSKTLTIRLLPFEPSGGSPFHKVYMHQVRVNNEVAASGWKTFPCPKANHISDACPFCEATEAVKREKATTIDEAKKRQLDEAEKATRAKKMWTVRCIERGAEEDGTKFWLISNVTYESIMALYNQRMENAKAKGKVNNIFDLNEGKDLLITLSRDGNKTKINIADDDEKTPLSTDYDKALSWINDPKKWTDVYTIKPYEYMDVVLGGGVPRYDKELGKYVDKDALLAKQNGVASAQAAQAASNTAEIEKAESVFGAIDNGGHIESADDLPF